MQTYKLNETYCYITLDDDGMFNVTCKKDNKIQAKFKFTVVHDRLHVDADFKVWNYCAEMAEHLCTVMGLEIN